MMSCRYPEVAQQLSVHPNSLYRWVSEYEKYGENAFTGNGNTIITIKQKYTGSNEGIRNLRRRLNS